MDDDVSAIGRSSNNHAKEDESNNVFAKRFAEIEAGNERDAHWGFKPYYSEGQSRNGWLTNMQPVS